MSDVIERPAGTRRLTADDLLDITGFRSPSRQCQWVRDHLGLEPAPRADGRPSITWEVYEQARLRVPQTGKPDSGRAEAPPNWNR